MKSYLQKCKTTFVFMKTLVFTPTCNNKTLTKGQGFITPPQHRQGGHPASVGGFSFALIAPVGDIHHKEVAIAKEGILHHSFNIVNQFFFQRGVSL